MGKGNSLNLSQFIREFPPIFHYHIISSGLADLLAERQAGAGGQRRDLRLRNHVVRRQQPALPAEGMGGNNKKLELISRNLRYIFRLFSLCSVQYNRVALTPGVGVAGVDSFPIF